MKKSKFYVVWVGNQPGIYTSWSSCEAQVKGYKNAKYKSFPTLILAQNAFNSSHETFIKKPSQTVLPIVDFPIEKDTIPLEFSHLPEYSSLDSNISPF